VVVQTHRIELVWHREYNVIMFNGQGALYQVVNPECLFRGLAFRAMPVAAAIITVTYSTTTFAGLLVTAKGSCTATGYFAQHF
jgi:hypothetical protein